MAAFQAAVTGGTTAQLTSLLSDDVRLTAVGKVPVVLDVLEGRGEVTEFIVQRLQRYWASYR